MFFPILSITLDILLSDTDLHTVFSVKSSMSPEATQEKQQHRDSNLLLMQFTSQPDTYWPYVTFINGKITFQQSTELEEGEACIIVRLKQN